MACTRAPAWKPSRKRFARCSTAMWRRHSCLPCRDSSRHLTPFGGAEYRVMMATGKVDRAALGAAPENFELREFVPQLQVLSQASLFVTHGGMNSVSEALWHEVPLLVFPQH